MSRIYVDTNKTARLADSYLKKSCRDIEDVNDEVKKIMRKLPSEVLERDNIYYRLVTASKELSYVEEKLERLCMKIHEYMDKYEEVEKSERKSAKNFNKKIKGFDVSFIEENDNSEYYIDVIFEVIGGGFENFGKLIVDDDYGLLGGLTSYIGKLTQFGKKVFDGDWIEVSSWLELASGSAEFFTGIFDYLYATLGSEALEFFKKFGGTRNLIAVFAGLLSSIKEAAEMVEKFKNGGDLFEVIAEYFDFIGEGAKFMGDVYIIVDNVNVLIGKGLEAMKSWVLWKLFIDVIKGSAKQCVIEIGEARSDGKIDLEDIAHIGIGTACGGLVEYVNFIPGVEIRAEDVINYLETTFVDNVTQYMKDAGIIANMQEYDSEIMKLMVSIYSVLKYPRYVMEQSFDSVVTWGRKYVTDALN